MLTMVHLFGIWIILVNCALVSLNQNVLRVEKYHQLSSVTRYAGCVNYELLLAQVRNMSLSHTQTVCNNLFKEQTKQLAKNMRDPNVINYVRHLLRGVNAGIRDTKNRKKRSVFGGGVQLRREVREPPYDTNWGCFVKGVRRLKNNYDVRPDMNTYDVIANLHTSDDVIPSAHDGPGFFSWHREYLKIMELALGCPIPYWDTTLDYAMKDPQESCVWSGKYFGNGYGLVTTGIMKNLPSWLPIVRNINSGGWLISRKDIQMAMAKPSLYEFTEVSPCNKEDRTVYSWECFHKGIHDWIDGTIGPSNTTTFDPVFFPIHAFIDKIFELYRHKLMSMGIDPEETYPVKNIAHHGPEHKTIWVPIYPDVEPLTNRQCYGEKLAALTKYSLGPKCPYCYGSDDLFCDTTLNVCVSKPRTTKDKYVMRTVAKETSDGVQLFQTLGVDEPERTKELIQFTGPLPFGKKFKVKFPDSRTRNDGTPEL